MTRNGPRVQQLNSRSGSAGPLLSIALSFVVAACSVGPGADPSASEPSFAMSGVPQPSTSVADTGEEPNTYPADNMWAFLATMPGLQRRSETLAEAVAFSDAVVVGRYIGVERGGQYGSDSTAIALIAVDSIAKGSPKIGSDGFLRVEFVLVVGSPKYPEKEFADLQRSIPKDPALLYLFSWDSYFKLIKDEIPGWSDRSDLSDVYKTIGGDGAMRIVDGRVEPPSYIDGWPTALKDAPIESVVTQIRAAAVETP